MSAHSVIFDCQHSDNCDEDVRRHCPACAAYREAFEAMREALRWAKVIIEDYAHDKDIPAGRLVAIEGTIRAALALAEKVSR